MLSSLLGAHHAEFERKVAAFDFPEALSTLKSARLAATGARHPTPDTNTN